METICKWVDAKTTLVIFSFCFVIRILIRFNNWWKNSVKTEIPREVKEENQRDIFWGLNWTRKNSLTIQDTPKEKAETKNFLQKSLKENNVLEIMVKSVLISAMILPLLVGKIYLLCEKAVIESPVLAFNLIKVILKSVFLPIIEKFIIPLSKIFYDSTKIALQKTQFLVLKATTFLQLKLKNLFFIGLDILKITYNNAKVFNRTICVPKLKNLFFIGFDILKITYANAKIFISTICVPKVKNLFFIALDILKNTFTNAKNFISTICVPKVKTLLFIALDILKNTFTNAKIFISTICLPKLKKMLFIALDFLKITCNNAKIFNSTICVPKVTNLFFIALYILKITFTNAKIFNSTICVPTIQFVQSTLVVTYSNIKQIAKTCTRTLIPLLSTIGKIFIQTFVDILHETVNIMIILYKKGKEISILLYNVSTSFVLKIVQFVSFLFSAGKLLTFKLYQTILVPLPKIMKTILETFLKHSLQAAMKIFDWLFCLVSKTNQLMLNIYLHLCTPVCKCMFNNVYKPTVEGMYLITNTLIKIIKIIIIPAIPPIVVFLQSVLYKCWQHCNACYALITGLFNKLYNNICNVMSVVTDWYWIVMSPVILEMCYAMWNMMCFISNLALTFGTQAQFVVIQSLNFIAEMYAQIYNSATVLICDLFEN